MGDDEPAVSGVEGDVAGVLASSGGELGYGEEASGGADVEDGDGVIGDAIAGVDEATVGGDDDLADVGGVLGEVRRER